MPAAAEGQSGAESTAAGTAEGLEAEELRAVRWAAAVTAMAEQTVAGTAEEGEAGEAKVVGWAAAVTLA